MRSRETCTCTVLIAPSGASSPHRARASRSALTGSLGCMTSAASTARGLVPPSATGPRSSSTSNGPRMRNSIVSWLPRYRRFGANAGRGFLRFVRERATTSAIPTPPRDPRGGPRKDIGHASNPGRGARGPVEPTGHDRCCPLRPLRRSRRYTRVLVGDQPLRVIRMALELRPNCEYCDKDPPPAALDARICTYECTFCADCVETRSRTSAPTAAAASCRARSARRPNGGPASRSPSARRRPHGSICPTRLTTSRGFRPGPGTSRPTER